MPVTPDRIRENQPVVPTLPAWPSGRNVVGWCRPCNRWHVHDREIEELPAAPGYYLACACPSAPLGIYRFELQPGKQPHKSRRGWLHFDAELDRLVRGEAPPVLPSSPLPATLSADAAPLTEVEVLTTAWCLDGCGARGLRCSSCGTTGCPCGSAGCPECGDTWPHTCRIPEYPQPCPACTTARDRAVAAWEEEPLDPEDDLALIADLPREADRLRKLQDGAKRHPIYQVMQRIGGDLRGRFLEAAIDGAEFDVDAAERFYTTYVCTCPNLDDGMPDQTFYQRHHEANRCPRCLVKDALEEAAHAALRTQARRVYQGATS